MKVGHIVITKELFDELSGKPVFALLDSYEGRQVLIGQVYENLRFAGTPAAVSACRTQLAAIRQYSEAQVQSLEQGWFIKEMEDLRSQIREIRRSRSGGAERVSGSVPIPSVGSLGNNKTH